MPHAAVTRTETLIRPIVLVVDDEPAVLDALRALLAARIEPAYRLETAASAEEALELVAELNASESGQAPRTTAGPVTEPAPRSPVALVISDEKMPGRSGTDLLIALRQSPAHRHGGRMIVTAYAGLPSAKKAINEAEVDRYYPKPWNAEGELLPAVRQVLVRFARTSGFDEFLAAEVVEFATRREDIMAVRRAWWEYVNLMGLPAEEMEVEAPAFEDPADADAIHVVVDRRSPRGRTAAATLRLRVGADGAAVLDALAFAPEEAHETTEALAVRTAVLEAMQRGARAAAAEAPFLRREIYQRLGFAPVDGAEPGATGQVAMSMPLETSPASPEPQALYARRFAAEGRLCACFQEHCIHHDYAAPRRRYFCPLDQVEGHVPDGFLGIEHAPH